MTTMSTADGTALCSTFSAAVSTSDSDRGAINVECRHQDDVVFANDHATVVDVDIKDDDRLHVKQTTADTNPKLSNGDNEKLARYKPSGTSIGLQAYAAEITQHLLEAQQSFASLPSLQNSVSRNISASDGNLHRHTSSIDSPNNFGDTSVTIPLDPCTRKLSASFDNNRKLSLNDTCSLGSGTCRICLEGDVTGEPLVNPCLCSGSASHVHITCLKKWLMTSGNTVCELCQYELDVGWKSTSMWKALKDLSRVKMTNRRICWALLVSIAALTLPLFCICIFVLDDEGLSLQLSQPASMALSYGVILISCVAYLALVFMVAYLTWKWDFCPNPGRCHFPSEIEIRIESLEERLKRGRTRRSSYYRNATPILNPFAVEGDRRQRPRRHHEIMDPYWMSGGVYI